jgi:hypothetical protein
MSIKDDIKNRLKENYTQEEVYNILMKFFKACYEDKSNTLDYFTALKVFDYFEEAKNEN